LNKIFAEYENEISISFKFELNVHLLTEQRKFNEALKEISTAIHFAPKMGLGYFLIEMYSCQSQVYLFMEDLGRAEIALKHAYNIREEIDAAVPFQLSNFYRSQLAYYLYQLNKSVSGSNRSQYSEYRARAHGVSKKLISVSQKAAQHRVEAYTFRGVYYWLVGKQGKALKWWRNAIEEGQCLNARLQLARTYFEIGRCLKTRESRYKVLDGQGADVFLDKSKKMFEEMDLQWDLDLLRKVEST
jgi:tetratricopeptide (TPR) repeat protein